MDRNPQVLWPADDEFDFRVVGSIKELETLIRGKAGERATARLVAGFCWPWSDPDAAGELEPDVRVGDWSMPWNARAEAGRLAPGIPKSDFWASDPRGIEQVGCVYTAQGFEFDYVGVIFGPDLGSMGDGSASATSRTTGSSAAASPSSSSPTSSRAPTASS